MNLIRTFALALSLAAIGASGEETLRSLEAINAFVLDPTPRHVPFELTGRVLSANPSPNTGEIVLADENGVRGEFYRFLHRSQPEPGDTVKARGTAAIDANHEPYVRIDELEILEHGPLPEPPFIRLSDTNARLHHLLTVRTEGVVIDAFPDEIDQRYMILLLKDGNTVVPVIVTRAVFGDCRNLIDATVRVTGIYRRNVGGVRKYAWPNIHPHTPGDIEIVSPPPQDPFDFPPLESRLYLTSDDIATMAKRSVTGEVLAIWSDSQAMVRTADGQVVNLTLAKNEPPPAVGATVVAAGQPETDLFRLNLTAARWKIAAAEPPRKASDETPQPISSAVFWHDRTHTSINATVHGQLLAARGIVRTLPADGDPDLRFILDDGGLAVTVDASGCPAALDGLEIGCEVAITGRCLLLTDGNRRRYNAAKIRGFALVVRSPSDVSVLSRPPWWTTTRLLVLVALLLAALVGIYIWNRFLARLVNRRGRELYREQVAHAISEFKTDERTRLAVELHDSLSQTLSGVACQLAVGDANLDRDLKSARTYLATARKMLSSCRTELRQCLFDLRSDTLDEPDFSAAIRKTLAQIESDAVITVRFNVPRQRLKDTTAHAILSIVRELTGNAIRHGGATAVKIAGALESDRILFSVRDNGRGFDPATCDGPREGHFGLEGIRNRLEKLNGSFAIDSLPGAGAKATIAIPIPKPPAADGARE